jgi:hypothetical protein
MNNKTKKQNKFHLLDLIIGVDLLDRLLSFDHRKRPTAVEALSKRS